MGAVVQRHHQNTPRSRMDQLGHAVALAFIHEA
jgi:hypothetical protein